MTRSDYHRVLLRGWRMGRAHAERMAITNERADYYELLRQLIDLQTKYQRLSDQFDRLRMIDNAQRDNDTRRLLN